MIQNNKYIETIISSPIINFHKVKNKINKSKVQYLILFVIYYHIIIMSNGASFNANSLELYVFIMNSIFTNKS